MPARAGRAGGRAEGLLVARIQNSRQCHPRRPSASLRLRWNRPATPRTGKRLRAFGQPDFEFPAGVALVTTSAAVHALHRERNRHTQNLDISLRLRLSTETTDDKGETQRQHSPPCRFQLGCGTYLSPERKEDPYLPSVASTRTGSSVQGVFRFLSSHRRYTRQRRATVISSDLEIPFGRRARRASNLLRCARHESSHLSTACSHSGVTASLLPIPRRSRSFARLNISTITGPRSNLEFREEKSVPGPDTLPCLEQDPDKTAI